MKRILTVCDSKHFSPGTVALGCYLARLTRSEVLGVFPRLSGSEDLPPYMPFGNEALVGTLVDSNNTDTVRFSIKRFRDSCAIAGVPCDVIREHNNAHDDLVAESRYADVLVMDAQSAFTAADDKVPAQFLTSLIADAACPVIIAPVSFDSVREIIFAYDGSPSSMFAIKQFSYLFPELSDKQVTVVEVSESGAIASYEKLEAWLRAHYPMVTFQGLQGDPSNRLFEVAMSSKNAILVVGESGRGALSKFFRPSAKDAILKFADLPVFIAHA